MEEDAFQTSLLLYGQAQRLPYADTLVVHFSVLYCVIFSRAIPGGMAESYLSVRVLEYY